MTCRRELPVVDNLAAEYGDRVAFVAPAWKSDPAAAEARAGELLSSGQVMWGLDQSEEIFAAYGVSYQPAGAIVDGDGTLVETWPGARPEAELRASIEAVLADAG